VTLQEIAALIRAGHEVQVIDSKTKADVTKAILVQIILEEEKDQKSVLPLSFLFQLLRSQEEAAHDFFRNYLSISFEAYIKTKSEFDRRFRGWLEMGASAPAMWEKLVPSAETMKEFLLPSKKDRNEK
jgi:polyhydroxyalkanoate synthesis repressor PhaR